MELAYGETWQSGFREKAAPMKRLILCCDGTWQAANQGNKSIPSNVAKIARAIAKHAWQSGNPKDPPIAQIVYYDAGIGTAMGVSRSKC